MKNRAIVIVWISFVLLFSGGFSLSVSATKATSSTGIVVPLYTYPTDSSWSFLINIKNEYPSVPIIAIINPNNGVGSSKDSNYVSGIKNLQAAGISVLGYVFTNYGSRSSSTIENQISDYKSWYGVNGIFFDEMGNTADKLAYYTILANYVSSINGGMTMGNPGTTVSTKLVGVFSILCIYENPGMPKTNEISGYTSYGKQGFSYIAYGVNDMPSKSTVMGTSNYVAYLYITNLGGSNPYNGLPSYIASEASLLSS
jgi:hypothetical protein